MFSSVQFSYSIYVSHSLIIKVMTAALKRSCYIETFQFSAGQRTVRVSVMSSSPGRLFHANAPVTEKLRGTSLASESGDFEVNNSSVELWILSEFLLL